jgi:hypothetical protein
MKVWTSACLVLLAAVLPARAHFIWILPDDPSAEGNTKVRVVFSDSTRPDKPALLAKIAGTELYVRGTGNKDTPLQWTKKEDAYEAAVTGKGPRLVGGVCRYGVFQHGKQPPILLRYYPAAYVGLPAQKGRAPQTGTKPWDRLALQILLPFKGGKVQALWHGKPLAGAEVVLLVPGKDKGVETKTDKDGKFTLAEPEGKGFYGIRVLHTEAREGEDGGKKYKEVRHYATLVFRVGKAGQPKAKENTPKKEDPAATKLLADARAARAQWDNFPGFTADIAVNFDGKVSKGKVTVNSRGKVSLELGDDAARTWAKRVLGSTVSHRLDNSVSLKTPCAFIDDNTKHPLGRAIRVLSDEFHSSYRIRDRQVIVVNREMKDQGIRFTITVLRNRRNKDKRFLPVSFVVNTWDVKTGALRSSETHYQTWNRADKFDLPLRTMVVTATAGKLEARTLTLSNLKLTPGTASR